MKINYLFGCLFLSACFSFAQPPVFIGGENSIGPSVMPGRGNDKIMRLGMNHVPNVNFILEDTRNMITNLNIDQKRSEKILNITRAFHNLFESKIIGVQRLELDIREELLKENVDLSKIESAVIKKTKIFSEIEFAQIKRDVEIKSILTAEEYEQWKQQILCKMVKFDGGPGKKGRQNGPVIPEKNGAED